MTKRTKADDAIERRLLELAYTTDAKITVPALAYYAPCTIEDASRVLDDLAARDRLSMNVEDDGTIVYELLGRQKLATAAPPALPAPPMLSPSVPHRAPPAASPLAAAVMSGFLPGAGHVYAGRVIAGILWFFAVTVGYVLILPGLVLHLFAMASAATAARRLNAAPPRPRLAAAW